MVLVLSFYQQGAAGHTGSTDKSLAKCVRRHSLHCIAAVALKGTSDAAAAPWLCKVDREDADDVEEPWRGSSQRGCGVADLRWYRCCKGAMNRP